jgi:RTX calcium-binding nonapeptide repeat (4 copies)
MTPRCLMSRRATLVAALLPGLLAAALATPLVTPSASAATGRAPKTMRCHGEPATLVGTRHDDRLVGTHGPDVIVGLKGDDRIVGRGGDHVICGGPGNDRLTSGGGDDRVYGGVGGDHLLSSPGNDFFDASPGPGDFLDYSRAHARVQIDTRRHRARVGKSGHDRFDDGLEDFLLTRLDDSFRSGRTGASVYGDAGDDVMVGGPGNDGFDGGPGNDDLDGGRGFDNLRGGLGVDLLVDPSGGGFYSDGEPKHHDRGGLIRTGNGRGDFVLYPGRREVHTGSAPDELVLRGAQEGSVIDTGDGGDRVLFRQPYEGGAMTLRLGDGDDIVTCSRLGCGGDSDLNGGQGRNAIVYPTITEAVTAVLGAIGSVSVAGFPGRSLQLFDFDDITTGAGDDDITGSDADNQIVTGDGDGNVSALGGDDLVAAGNGDDTADGGEGQDQCYEVESPTNCETVGRR